MAASSQVITVDGFTSSVPTLPAAIPGLTGAYIVSLTDLPGVVAANNFVSVFNPVASGRNLYFLGMFISTYVASGASTTRNSMQGKQITAASGGTLITGAANIFKPVSTYPNNVSEVRTGNPTVTANATFLNSPPPIGTSTGQYVHSVGLGASQNGGGLFFAPGEGFVLTTAAGNTSQTWNISVVFGEGTP